MGFYVTCPHCGGKFEVNPGGKKRDYAASIDRLMKKLRAENPYVWNEIMNNIYPRLKNVIALNTKDFYVTLKNIARHDDLMHHFTNSDLLVRAAHAQNPVKYYKAAVRNAIVLNKGESAWKE